MFLKHLFLFTTCCFIGCNKPTSYLEDYKLIAAKCELIELTTNNGNARITISPQLQGKILIVSNEGENGGSFGWFNKSAFQRTDFDETKVGGVDRIWVGPLGSQFSFYYQQIKPLDEANWKVPRDLSKGRFSVLTSTRKKVSMHRSISLTNFIGNEFHCDLSREISILNRDEVEKQLNTEFSDHLKFVAFKSEHVLKNIGVRNWTKSSGLVSLWSAGMFKGTGVSTVIIPVGNSISKGKSIYRYMGNMDDTRLKVSDSLVLFKVDGRYRSKIGVSNFVAKQIYGCYQPSRKTLTIVKYKKTSDSLYFNTQVSIQKTPYLGESIPIYNNGPMDYSLAKEPSFYELETVSSMKELEVGEAMNHSHSVFIFTGEFSSLNILSEKLLGVGLERIEG